MLHANTCRAARRPAAFTMVELLVVIVVLGLLITLVTALAARAIRQQRERNTQQIMQNVTLALEQFATENPLAAIYDRRGRETFGEFPPYQLNGAASGNQYCVSRVLEDSPPNGWGNNKLSDRLWRDLGNGASPKDNWVVIGPEMSPPAGGYPDGHDDNRALYAYLKVFSPGVMSLIPENAVKPLYPQVPPESRSYVNSRGLGAVRGNAGAEDVLGIHDAWGVPLDYTLYVKCEWGLRQNPTTGQEYQSFRVVERRPVLRSLGIKREVYDATLAAQPDPTQRDFDESKWIFSAELPKPWAVLTDGPGYRQGILNNSLSPTSRANGWLRAVGLNEDYAYRPDGDMAEP